MNVLALFNEIVALYLKHGWQVRRVLLRSETRAQFDQNGLVETIPMIAAEVDGVWFSRPSHSGREAWELRLLSENPYALFETFEADETPEEREDVLKEMENKMREYLTTQRSN